MSAAAGVGVIRMPRPISIDRYNKYMGGVDLADMRRLHSNSTKNMPESVTVEVFFISSTSARQMRLYLLANEYCRVQNGIDRGSCAQDHE
jgi:hypothetical protein